MRNYFIVFFLTTLLIGCKKQSVDTKPDIKLDITPIELTGNYKGIFYRTVPNYIPLVSKVTLQFEQKNFSGTSQFVKHPAICKGEWATENGIIKFSNSCPWTAEFDWTFILNGEYQYKIEGNKLKIWRSYNNTVYDTYELEK